jgi:ArsR family transcriptional regulator
MMLLMARAPVTRVAPEELQARLAGGEPIVVLDVRGRSYQTSDLRVAGAVRIPPRELEDRLEELPSGRPIVAYCT